MGIRFALTLILRWMVGIVVKTPGVVLKFLLSARGAWISSRVASKIAASKLARGRLTAMVKTALSKPKGKEVVDKLMKTETGLVTRMGGSKAFKASLSSGKILELKVADSFFKRMIAFCLTVIMTLGVSEILSFLWDTFWSDEDDNFQNPDAEVVGKIFPIRGSTEAETSRLSQAFGGLSVQIDSEGDYELSDSVNWDTDLDEDGNSELTLDEIDSMTAAFALFRRTFGSGSNSVEAIKAFRLVMSNPDLAIKFFERSF